MGNVSLWAVEGLLCLPLGLLVWASQHVLNTLHPSRRHLLLGQALPRVIVLLVLLVATCLLATCLFLAAMMSALTLVWAAAGLDGCPFAGVGLARGDALGVLAKSSDPPPCRPASAVQRRIAALFVEMMCV